MVHDKMEASVIAKIDPGYIVWIGSVLGLLLLLGTVAMVIIRKRLRPGSDEDIQPGVVFSLEDLRNMHQKGQISEKEYEALRKQIIQQSRQA